MAYLSGRGALRCALRSLSPCGLPGPLPASCGVQRLLPLGNQGQLRLPAAECSLWASQPARFPSPGRHPKQPKIENCPAQGAVPMGSQEWGVQRVAAGVPGHGTELTGEFTPFEAGERAVVSFGSQESREPALFGVGELQVPPSEAGGWDITLVLGQLSL